MFISVHAKWAGDHSEGEVSGAALSDGEVQDGVYNATTFVTHTLDDDGGSTVSSGSKSDGEIDAKPAS